MGMKKAKDHTGYGRRGQAVKGEMLTTTISFDSPDWMVGPRNFPGPLDCERMPVRRPPTLSLKPDGTWRLITKSYQRGPAFSTLEHWRDKPPSLRLRTTVYGNCLPAPQTPANVE